MKKWFVFTVILVILTGALMYREGRWSMFNDIKSSLTTGRPVQIGSTIIQLAYIQNNKNRPVISNHAKKISEAICDKCHVGGIQLPTDAFESKEGNQNGGGSGT